MKYNVDDWVLYKPFINEESTLLQEICDRALILAHLPIDPFYDYKIILEESGKIKKVREHQLFPDGGSTY